MHDQGNDLVQALGNEEAWDASDWSQAAQAR